MTPEKFLELEPKFHYDENNEPISWGIGKDVLAYVGESLPAGSRTAETGSGISTVFFAAAGFRNTAVSPDEREFESIRRFCGEHDISLASTTMLKGFSEDILPTIKFGPLDMALIDGRHGFPTPYIDWYYFARALKVGGWMIVDDTQILTGKVLDTFMDEDAHWRLLRRFDKTSVFEKLDDQVHAGEWNSQAYILNRLEG
jgi:hypothetical protein